MATRGRRQYNGVFTETLGASATINLASIATAGQNTSNTVTVPGAALGDHVRVSTSISQAGLDIAGYVSAANTVTIIAQNNSGGAIDLASCTFYVLVEKVDPAIYL